MSGGDYSSLEGAHAKARSISEIGGKTRGPSSAARSKMGALSGRGIGEFLQYRRSEGLNLSFARGAIYVKKG
jgi:hypothetical protein